MYVDWNQLGNVLTTVSDRRIGVTLAGNPNLIDHYTAVILSSNDYYAFGSKMPGRGYAGTQGYRYGFNGKEDDNETGWQDYGMRIYNPQLARFFTVDPLRGKYPWYSPYQFAGNKPIWKIDLDGLEEADPAKKEAANSAIAEFANSDRTGKWTNIDKNEFVTSLYNIINNPESLSQGDYSLCGFTATLKAAATKDPEGFVNNAISLFETGQFASGDNHKVPTEIMQKKVEGGLNPASFVFLMSVKSKYNMSGELRGDPGSFLEQCSGITLPSSVSNLIETYFNIGIVSKGSYDYGGKFDDESYINNANKENKMVIALFDWGALRKGKAASTSWHYVQVLGVEKILTETDSDPTKFYGNSKVALKIFDPAWGENRTIETSYVNYSQSIKWYMVVEEK